jgi:hypothetical protein
MFFRQVFLEPKKKYTLQTITREIQQQTGISFSYNAAHINPGTKVKLKTDRITVEQLLGTIRKKTGIGYKVISKTHIIYTEAGAKRRKKGKSKKRKATPAPVYVRQNNETRLRSIEGEGVAGQQIVIIGDSSVAAYYFSGGASSGGGYTGHDMTKYPVVLDVTDEEYEEDEPAPYSGRHTNNGYANAKTEVVNYLKGSTLIAIGFAADETYYSNPTARVGFDFLYGTVSYNLGPYAHWRYGIGGSAKVNDRFSLHLNITTGQGFSEKYNIQRFDTIPPTDSIQDPQIIETNTPLLVQSKLTRFTLSAEWNLGRGFTLGGGLILNRLKTSYSSYGNPVTLSNMLPIGYDADAKYQTINPPYLLGNSYSGNATTNIKTWIGLQLTLIYRLQFFE